jgi:hypothetical protein
VNKASTKLKVNQIPNKERKILGSSMLSGSFNPNSGFVKLVSLGMVIDVHRENCDLSYFLGWT